MAVFGTGHHLVDGEVMKSKQKSTVELFGAMWNPNWHRYSALKRDLILFKNSAPIAKPIILSRMVVERILYPLNWVSMDGAQLIARRIEQHNDNPPLVESRLSRLLFPVLHWLISEPRNVIEAKEEAFDRGPVYPRPCVEQLQTSQEKCTVSCKFCHPSAEKPEGLDLPKEPLLEQANPHLPKARFHLQPSRQQNNIAASSPDCKPLSPPDPDGFVENTHATGGCK